MLLHLYSSIINLAHQASSPLHLSSRTLFLYNSDSLFTYIRFAPLYLKLNCLCSLFPPFRKLKKRFPSTPPKSHAYLFSLEKKKFFWLNLLEKVPFFDVSLAWGRMREGGWEDGKSRVLIFFYWYDFVIQNLLIW